MRPNTLFEFVTEHNLLVVALLLVLTAGVGAGIPQLNLDGGATTDGIGEETQTVQKANYVQSAYLNQSDSSEDTTTTAVVYVRADDNALSKSSLVASLEYQQTVLDNESVAAGLDGRQPRGVANVVGKRAAGPEATVDEQLAALRAASPEEVERLVRETLTEGAPALALLPADYEPGTATAESRRTVFRFTDGTATDDEAATSDETATDDGAATGDETATAGAETTTADATRALYEATESSPAFTLGEHAAAAQPNQLLELLWLVVPFSLAAILSVLVFVYRDLVDVVVGFVGIVVSLVWTFGAIGWIGFPVYFSLVIAPVLIVGLGVDYGLHVFMRYREERGDNEGLRAPMARSTTGLASALLVVTFTAVIGFMANATTELASIRRLAYGISLGVIGTFVVSVTLVPALKITLDSALTRLGFDRRKRPLGKSGFLAPVLSGGARLARRAAPLVLVVGLVVGGVGAATWSDLDRETFESNGAEVADWKTALPEPVGWTESEYAQNGEYVRDHYRAAAEDERTQSPILIEPAAGDAATATVLERVQALHEAAPDRDVVYSRGGTAPLTSPVTVMQSVAAADESFAAVLQDADTDGDGVPERNVERVYDALFEAAPDKASRVIDRTDDGYRSVLVSVPVAPGADYGDRGEQMQALADDVATDDTVVTATGTGPVNAVQLDVISNALVQTMLVGLTGVAVLLTLVYRLTAGSATLGLVTAVPIVLVTALVVGGMWLLDVPLTANTALLLSLVIGLGIDYNVHVSDRFEQELARGHSVHPALIEATTGTGGALLGSTLTTVASFSALLIAPFAFFQNFGVLVVVALVTSFLVAVFVLPSLLTLWARYGPTTTGDTTQVVPSDD
jgi:predicted RND superfamily exporter protein